jgi:DNA-binding NtrC family response regulator
VNKQWNILVVDDEMIMRESMAAWLMEDGYQVDTAESGHDAIAMVTDNPYAICFVDLKMPGIDGIETMMEILKIQPDTSAIIITAYATVDTAITAMKEGAQEYIVKPCNPQEISLLVQRIIKIKTLERENKMLRKRLLKQYEFHDIISKNPKMNEIFELIKDVASLPSTVLVQGESGTGKEMIARAIHQAGEKKSKPFIAVSCAALAESILESELFGHEKGAFTGATERKLGKFELAAGGTLFLDEIGDISPKLQKELLRVLQERSFFRVGGTSEVKVDVRVIAASNRDLREETYKGNFREDLFYRLNVININIPPLRERREDIPLLTTHFIERIALELGRGVNGISDGAIKLLLDRDWPGNIRELENTIERAIVSCRDKILAPEAFAFLTDVDDSRSGYGLPGNMSLEAIERMAIEATLKRCDGNIKETASVLGIDRSTLYDKIKRYDIKR